MTPDGRTLAEPRTLTSPRVKVRAVRQVVGTTTARALAVLAVLLLVGPAAPAAALDPLGCGKEPPAITAPGDGLAGWLDAGPADPRPGDPFAPGPDVPPATPGGEVTAGPPVTTPYETHGWAGFAWPQYDLGCGPDEVTTGVGDQVAAGLAELELTSLTWASAATAQATRWALGRSPAEAIEPVLQLMVSVFGNVVFAGFAAITLVLLAAWVWTRAHRGDLREASSATGWVVVLAAASAFVISAPTLIGATVFGGVTGTVATVAGIADDQLGGTAAGLPPGDTLATQIHSGIAYQTWCAGIVGRPNSQAAQRFCPLLYSAGSLTRTELAATGGDPDALAEATDAKEEAYRAAAEQLKDADPAAYAYLAGHHPMDRAGYGALGWIAFLAIAGPLLIALFLMVAGAAAAALVMAVLPGLAVVGLFWPARLVVTKPVDYALGMLVTGVVYGCIAIVQIVAVTQLLAPTSGIAAPTAAAVGWLLGVVALKLTRPLDKARAVIHPFSNAIRHRGTSRPDAASGGPVDQTSPVLAVARIGPRGGPRDQASDEDDDYADATPEELALARTPTDPRDRTRSNRNRWDHDRDDDRGHDRGVDGSDGQFSGLGRDEDSWGGDDLDDWPAPDWDDWPATGRDDSRGETAAPDKPRGRHAAPAAHPDPATDPDDSFFTGDDAAQATQAEGNALTARVRGAAIPTAVSLAVAGPAAALATFAQRVTADATPTRRPDPGYGRIHTPTRGRPSPRLAEPDLAQPGRAAPDRHPRLELVRAGDTTPDELRPRDRT